MDRRRRNVFRQILVSLGLTISAAAFGCSAGGNSTGAGGGGSGGSGGQACVPAEEVCDGVDNDCNGQVDEGGCVCHIGDTQACWSGPMEVRGIGACKDGEQTCDETGQWGGPCVGEVLADTEVCNGLDDDCDGQVDEDLADVTCGVGACEVTVSGCEAGTAPVCKPLSPTTEVCDGVDNDCNGQTDEADAAIGTACSTGGIGVCASGKNQCMAGALVCVPDMASMPETCDGADNDCNGTVDDPPGAGSVCATGKVGVCAAGTKKCSAGSFGCVQTTASSPETCNGLDDDCDGKADQNNPGGGMACNSGLPGACAAGVVTCAAGALSCVGGKPGPEACNKIDDNCDGQVDENNPGGGATCATGKLGPCALGTLTCVNGAVSCVENVAPTAEICDGLDNDCDGQPDDGIATGGPCNTGLPGVCATGIIKCTSGMLKCESTAPPASESCNGQDDNCTGTIDEGNPGGGAQCNTGLLGACGKGFLTCTNGALTCPVTVQPSTEVCQDAVDNDCDGQTDEGCAITCAHLLCVTGVALTVGCHPCVTSICAVDSYCCSGSWDSICVGEVTSVCGATCPGL